MPFWEEIAKDTAVPTFDNTIVAMERSGELLTRASKVFFAMTQANTNDALQAAKERLAPQLAAHDDAIHLNPKLFARVQAVYAARDKLGAGELAAEARKALDAEGEKIGAQILEIDLTPIAESDLALDKNPGISAATIQALLPIFTGLR